MPVEGISLTAKMLTNHLVSTVRAADLAALSDRDLEIINLTICHELLVNKEINNILAERVSKVLREVVGESGVGSDSHGKA